MRILRWLAVIALMACGGERSTSPAPSIAGTWSLKSINGTALPFVYAQTGANKNEITSDVYTLTADGSFTQLLTVRQTLNGQVSTQTYPDAGHYTLNGTAVTIYWNSDGTNATGSWSGNTLTLAANGFASVYGR